MEENSSRQKSARVLIVVSIIVASIVVTVCAAAYPGRGANRPSERDASGFARAEKVVEIRSTGIDLSYSVATIEAKAGEELTIRYINESETLPHNIVVVKEEKDIRPVGIAALKAHENDYIPEDELDRIIAYSAMAHPGDTVEVSFTVPPPGIYPYICTYSGHFTMMQGQLISTK